MADYIAFADAAYYTVKSAIKAEFPWAKQIVMVKGGWWVFESVKEAEEFRIEIAGSSEAV